MYCCLYMLSSEILFFPQEFTIEAGEHVLRCGTTHTWGQSGSELLDCSSRNGQYCPITVPAVDGMGGFNRLAICAPQRARHCQQARMARQIQQFCLLPGCRARLQYLIGAAHPDTIALAQSLIQGDGGEVDFINTWKLLAREPGFLNGDRQVVRASQSTQVEHRCSNLDVQTACDLRRGRNNFRTK